jgi:hypothetical protein
MGTVKEALQNLVGDGEGLKEAAQAIAEILDRKRARLKDDLAILQDKLAELDRQIEQLDQDVERVSEPLPEDSIGSPQASGLRKKKPGRRPAKARQAKPKDAAKAGKAKVTGKSITAVSEALAAMGSGSLKDIAAKCGLETGMTHYCLQQGIRYCWAKKVGRGMYEHVKKAS